MYFFIVKICIAFLKSCHIFKLGLLIKINQWEIVSWEITFSKTWIGISYFKNSFYKDDSITGKIDQLQFITMWCNAANIIIIKMSKMVASVLVMFVALICVWLPYKLRREKKIQNYWAIFVWFFSINFFSPIGNMEWILYNNMKWSKQKYFLLIFKIETIV